MNDEFKIKIVKVWGEEEILVSNELYAAKYMKLKQNYRCSIHMHKIKDETFKVLSGVVLLLHNDIETTLVKGMTVRIKPGEYHRFTGITNAVILEVSTQDTPEDSYRKTKSEKVPKNE